MLKHIYRIIILVIIFVASLYYFGRDIKEVVFDINNTTSMEHATFPLVTFRTDETVINLLHGYSSNLDANSIREALTPIGMDQTYELMIDQKAYDIKKLNFELREFVGNELIEKGSVSVFDEDEGLKIAKIRLNTELQNDKEYAVKITLITGESRKIYYYHRIKKHYNTYLPEKIGFVMDFHEAIKDKDRAKEYTKNLEPDSKKENTTLAQINIHSSFDLITWGELRPDFITDVIPTVVENYSDIAAIKLEYIISANVSGIPELYRVKEFYRIRYSSSQMFLLNYERSMETIFDIKLASVSKSQLKLGITTDPGLPYLASSDKKKIAFVRNRELWFYNLDKNEIVRVFTFRQEDTDYIRDLIDQHDIRILNMDEEGNVDFMVYGYMNRGQYEGRVALVLYEYIQADQRIEEKAYIPIDEPYQTLKENIGEFAYVNSLDVFYFHIYNSIYAYDLITRQLTELANNITKNDLVTFYQEGYVAWQESSNPWEANNIIIMDIERGELKNIESPPGYKIQLLDKIDKNLVYGFVSEADITTLPDGRVMIPISRLEIGTTNGDVLKTYYKDGYYITDIEVKDNIIELSRVSIQLDKGRKVFINESSDYIMNKSLELPTFLNPVIRVTDLALTEFYIELPSGFVMDKLPRMLTTVNTVISEDPTLRLPKDSHYKIESEAYPTNQMKYYTYILGELEGAYDEAADAIATADNGVGVVLTNTNHFVWERAVKTSKNIIPGFETMDLSSSQDSLETCVKLLIGYMGIDIDSKVLDLNNISVIQILNQYSTGEAIRLTGASLEQVLYHVSKGRPVIAMTSSTDAVLIYGYDAYNIYMIDPKQGKAVKKGIQDSTNLFENAGNIYISTVGDLVKGK